MRTQAYPQLQTYPAKERILKILIWVVSVVVLLLVGAMRQFKIPVPEGWDVGFLPAVNATLNALTAVALLVSLYFIKRKEVVKHRNANAVALGLSALFLVCYVVYHFTTPEVIYGDLDNNGVLSAAESAAATNRPVYLVILLSHIVLAGILLPFILLTTLRAVVGKYAAHRKMARYVWPLWLYVAITGPVVYLMLAPYYP